MSDLPNIYVLYHSNCTDGMAAAWVVRKKIQEMYLIQEPINHCKFIAVNYQQPVPDIKPNSIVYIVDFSFPKKELLKLAKKSSRVILIDHHDTAQKELQGLEDVSEKLTIHFDMNESGATLAWKVLYPSSKVPLFLQYIRDRDLWKWELPGSQAYSSYIHSFDRDIPLFDRFYTGDINSAIESGSGILRYQEQLVNKLSKRFLVGHYPDTNSYFAQLGAGVLQSEIGNTILQRYPKLDFAVIYDHNPIDQVYFLSFRSQPHYACNLVAKNLGGGGHPQAAGATIKQNELTSIQSKVTYLTIEQSKLLLNGK